MEWSTVSGFSFYLIIFPTLLFVAAFFYAARKAHLKHIERINKIKQGYFLSEEE